MFRAGRSTLESETKIVKKSPLFPCQVKHSVATMETLCQKLQQTHFLKGSGGMRGPLARK